MQSQKTEKELAFLHDLFVATDWDERFATLIDEHLDLPKEGAVAYVGSGTGGHAIAIKQRGGKHLNLTSVDENQERVELAKAKAATVNELIEFRKEQLENLSLPDNHFDLVIGNASLVPTERIKPVVSEMIRVANPGATVILTLPTASSFAEFFSIYWEALHNSGLVDHESDVEKLITELPTISDVERFLSEDLDDVVSTTRVEEFDYESGEQFLNSPLIKDFLMEGWLASLPEDRREQVSAEIARIINEERHDAEFALTVKATIMTGRKARTN
jgi:ubiquinone/menaquinone biosynthesis C-methylase UbiE